MPFEFTVVVGFDELTRLMLVPVFVVADIDSDIGINRYCGVRLAALLFEDDVDLPDSHQLADGGFDGGLTGGDDSEIAVDGVQAAEDRNHADAGQDREFV